MGKKQKESASPDVTLMIYKQLLYIHILIDIFILLDIFKNHIK